MALACAGASGWLSRKQMAYEAPDPTGFRVDRVRPRMSSREGHASPDDEQIHISKA